MAYYVAYMLNNQGVILSREDVNAEDDAAAVEAGHKLSIARSTDILDPVQGVEVWIDQRMVFSSHPRMTKPAN